MKRIFVSMLVVLSSASVASAQTPPMEVRITITIGDPTMQTVSQPAQNPAPQPLIQAPSEPPILVVPQAPPPPIQAPMQLPPLMDPELQPSAQPIYQSAPMIDPYAPRVRFRRVMPDFGGPIPPGYSRQSRRSNGLLVSGTALFAATYLLTMYGGALCSSFCRDSGFAFVPIVGPFILAAENSGAYSALLVLDGLAQAAGLALLIAGVTRHHSVLVRNSEYSARRDPGVEWAIMPSATPSTAGLSLAARF